MNISYKVLLAPFVGALAAFLAAHGFDLGPGTTDALITALAGVATAVAHYHDRKTVAPDKNNQK